MCVCAYLCVRVCVTPRATSPGSSSQACPVIVVATTVSLPLTRPRLDSTPGDVHPAPTAAVCLLAAGSRPPSSSSSSLLPSPAPAPAPAGTDELRRSVAALRCLAAAVAAERPPLTPHPAAPSLAPSLPPFARHTIPIHPPCRLSRAVRAWPLACIRAPLPSFTPSPALSLTTLARTTTLATTTTTGATTPPHPTPWHPAAPLLSCSTVFASPVFMHAHTHTLFGCDSAPNAHSLYHHHHYHHPHRFMALINLTWGGLSR